uniref:Uncharacterized protein n=1 Tax=Cucumis sativus TaxID=3659 RepID=A0A0A0LZY1_CUCSA
MSSPSLSNAQLSLQGKRREGYIRPFLSFFSSVGRSFSFRVHRSPTSSSSSFVEFVSLSSVATHVSRFLSTSCHMHMHQLDPSQSSSKLEWLASIPSCAFWPPTTNL